MVSALQLAGERIAQLRLKRRRGQRRSEFTESPLHGLELVELAPAVLALVDMVRKATHRHAIQSAVEVRRKALPRLRTHRRPHNLGVHRATVPSTL